MVGGALGSRYFGRGHAAQGLVGTALLVVLCVAFAVMGLYMAAWAFKAHVILRDDDIELKGTLRTARLSRAEIAGWRTLQQRNGPPDFVLVPRSGQAKKMRLSQTFDFDEGFSDWIEQFPNLDQRDQETSLKGILENAEFGGSTEQRSEKLRAARKISTGSTIVTIGIAAWAWLILFLTGL
ncbi:MAG: hypothetical protein ACM3JB_24575 [Acidobacteriaceae bacterium]